MSSVNSSWGWIAATVASYLSDPLCNMHEEFRTIPVVQDLNKKASVCDVRTQQVILGGKVLFHLCLCPLPSLIGMGIRWIMGCLQSEPFLYYCSSSEEKQLKAGKPFTLFSWNICGPWAGYSLTDGGTTTWHARLDKIIKKIDEQKADVVLLYEVFDIKTSNLLIAGLEKKGYVHFFHHIDARALGASSTLFVASKIKIDNPKFTRFGPDELDGRTSNSNKGFLKFEILCTSPSKDHHDESKLLKPAKKAATIYTTHFQHSERPTPSDGEKRARKKEMILILDDLEKQTGEDVFLVVGDLNCDPQELKEITQDQFEMGTVDPSILTWCGGNERGEEVYSREHFPPQTLDYALLYKNNIKGLSITTTYVDPLFNSKKYSKKTLSDHYGLLTTVALAKLKIEEKEEITEVIKI